MSVLTQTGEGELSGGYLDGCQDFWSLPKRVSGRRAAQKPRSVLTQTGEKSPVLTQTGKKGLGPYLDGFAP